ncbi:hypothetical protein G5V59_14975 [Nocardioides sp. W3-2-3]|nr:hypothetical protein [Nocardioides convexus]
MSRTRFDGLPPGKIASHLGVMLLVAAVLGVVVSGLAIPFAGVAGFTARNVADSVDSLPQELETEQAAAAHRDPRQVRQDDRHALRPEPGQRPAPPDLAHHGPGDRGDRGLPLLPARRARPEGHVAGAAHQPGVRRRRPGRVLDHPAGWSG